MSQQEEQHGSQHKQDNNHQEKEPDRQPCAGGWPVFTGCRLLS
jgi:hypothetical protein